MKTKIRGFFTKNSICGILRGSESSIVGHIANRSVSEFCSDFNFSENNAIDFRFLFRTENITGAAIDRKTLRVSPKVG